ncbi:hypothetical protein QP178_00355 [Sphingomonas aurantiaca]|uniref:hypothetical protein n=1 Tax=Sphingomonas aurantiaca TaxID=185949 RepID=UPI002FE20058
MRRALIGVALASLGLSGAAAAQEREYCPDRPGIDTPACTIAPGRISVETSLADWTRDDQPGSREDNILFGDTLVRVGVSDTIEARIGFTPFGHNRMRDLDRGRVGRRDRRRFAGHEGEPPAPRRIGPVGIGPAVRDAAGWAVLDRCG